MLIFIIAYAYFILLLSYNKSDSLFYWIRRGNLFKSAYFIVLIVKVFSRSMINLGKYLKYCWWINTSISKEFTHSSISFKNVDFFSIFTPKGIFFYIFELRIFILWNFIITKDSNERKLQKLELINLTSTCLQIRDICILFFFRSNFHTLLCIFIEQE